MGENVAFRAALHLSANLNRTHFLMWWLNALVNALAHIRSYIFLKTVRSLAYIFWLFIVWLFIVRLVKSLQCLGIHCSSKQCQIICVTQIKVDISLASLSMTIWSRDNQSFLFLLKKQKVPFTATSSFRVFLVYSLNIKILKSYNPACINANANTR